MIRRTGCATVQVVLVADAAVLARRYRARAAHGLRHPGHRDDELGDEVLAAARAFRPLDMPGITLLYDSTDFARVDAGAIARDERRALGPGRGLP